MTTTAQPESAAPARVRTFRVSAAGLLFGPQSQARWVRPSLLALLAFTTVLDLWGLASMGWGNDFYAASAWAGSQDWKALLFGSVDPGNAITVDKPPASLWAMALSARAFGFTPFAVMLPQALMGVGSVALLYAAVRRWSGPAAGLLAGLVLALTPVAALMFRYDNPDALLVLLLVAAAYCTIRATETGSTRWMVFAGVAIGFGFLTKLLQAFLVLPAFAAVFLIAAPISLWARVRGLLVAALTVAVSGGWYVLLVDLWPKSSRPFVGGSTDNSLWELTVGYNGLGRILGGSGNPTAGGHQGPTDSSGITRLFTGNSATEVTWLLPLALLGLAAGLWITRRNPRTDPVRAGLILWGGWLLVTGVVFTFMSGIYHEYYNIALAPAVAAVAAISVSLLWSRRESLSARLILATMAAGTGAWTFVLLDHTPDWHPQLRWMLLFGNLAAATMVLVAHRTRVPAALILTGTLLFGLGGTTAYTLETIAQPHQSGIVVSGPASGNKFAALLGGSHDDPALTALLSETETRWAAATPGTLTASTLELASGKSVIGLGGFMTADPAPTLPQFQRYVAAGEIRYFVEQQRGGPGSGPGPKDPTESGETGPSTQPFDDTTRASAQITTWVKSHFASTQVGDSTVYDLTQPKP